MSQSKVMNRHTFLRLIVLCLLILATVKLMLRPTSTERLRSHSDVRKDPDFWRQRHDPEPDPVIVEDDYTEVKEESMTQMSKDQEEQVEKIHKSQMKLSTSPFRVVHLDLKGAPPKVKYLEQLFPLLSSLGANAILMEYEDMFPYEGELEVIRSSFAYSVDDIEEIKRLATINKLELIPLVQVFGHLEFVLKHKKYFSLREVAAFPNSLNPLSSGGLQLVKKMLMQVLKRHSTARFFHIGADEVFALGEGEDSKHWLEQNNGNVGALYLNHVKAVCLFLANIRPQMQILYWDDMLRKINVSIINQSGLPHLASPVIWNYRADLKVTFIEQLLTKYQEAGITGIWFASAFKGASGIDQRWTPINHHLQNHLAWIKVINSLSRFPSLKFQGIVLTGWQRYEHHTVLCELLPVAIPSVAVCLQTLKNGSFTKEAQNAVHKFLGCQVKLDTGTCEGSGSFPGSDVYNSVQKIHNSFQSSINKILNHSEVRGALTPHRRKNSYGNPRNIGMFKDQLRKLLTEWDEFMHTFRTEMEAVYYSDTVDEWMDDNVNQHMEQLHSLLKDAERIFELNGKAINS